MSQMVQTKKKTFNGRVLLLIAGKGRPTMEWSKRLNIALGSAKGLAYLHEDCKHFHTFCSALFYMLSFRIFFSL